MSRSPSMKRKSVPPTRQRRSFYATYIPGTKEIATFVPASNHMQRSRHTGGAPPHDGSITSYNPRRKFWLLSPQISHLEAEAIVALYPEEHRHIARSVVSKLYRGDFHPIVIGRRVCMEWTDKGSRKSPKKGSKR